MGRVHFELESKYHDWKYCLLLPFSASSVMVSHEPTCSGLTYIGLVQSWIASFGLVNFLWKGLLPQ